MEVSYIFQCIILIMTISVSGCFFFLFYSFLFSSPSPPGFLCITETRLAQNLKKSCYLCLPLPPFPDKWPFLNKNIEYIENIKYIEKINVVNQKWLQSLAISFHQLNLDLNLSDAAFSRSNFGKRLLSFLCVETHCIKR